MNRNQEKFFRRTRYQLLRGWYGEKRARIEMVAHTPQPVNAGDVIEHLCEGLADPDVANFIALETRWKEIVGAQMAAYARPARLHDGVLCLEVRHSSLLRELQPSLDLFLARIHRIVGPTVCTSLRLIPAGSVNRRR